MIILKYLQADRFRLLRDVSVHFPQRGSILVSGPNEAGKSTLIEAIYFALYGEPLAASGKRKGDSKLNDLISYGQEQASVSLALSIGAKELSITRTIQRNRGQTVSLDVRQLGMPPEKTITDLQTANERIVAELGRIDGKTLRHTCLIEQKGLNRLETLSGRERELVLRNILGLEKLSRLADHFRLTTEDERQLELCGERLKLAEIQARVPELSAKLGELEAALDAVTITEDLAEISQQEAAIADTEREQEQVATRRLDLKSRQQRIEQLRKADTTLEQIITAYDVIAEVQRELPELEHQIAELERREKEELPALEQRVRDLGDLTRSFGTLERIAGDLLAAVSTIADLEEGFKQQEHMQETLADLEEQIAHARQLVEDTQQSQHEVEEQHRSGRPQLETRLQRLQALTEKLTAVQQAQEKHDRRAGQHQEAEENARQLEKARQDLAESEKELTLVENEAQQVQAKAEAEEKRWRQLSVRHELQQWQRLKEMAEGIAEAQQHVEMADQQRARLNAEMLDTRRSARGHLLIMAGGAALVVLCLVIVLVELHTSSLLAALAGIAALALLGVGGASLQSYNRARRSEGDLDRQLQEAINRVGMMVAARETAVRMNSNPQAVAQVEHEIRSLGSNVPRSIEEAQFMLQQLQAGNESLSDAQQQMTRSREQAVAAREQLNVTMEAVAALRKEKARLQELRKQEGWDDMEGNLHADAHRVELIQKEIVLAAAQEGLPVPDYGAKSASSAPSDAELRTKLAESIKATEQELATLSDKVGAIPQISAKIQMHQEALDALLARRQSLKEQYERFQATHKDSELERAYKQQDALREALRALQDSLRQRVQPLGVSFGQAAISIAESTARKQLDALQAALAGKEGLQHRYTSRAILLQENQAALSEHYRTLARFSGSLGSWIVPPNPFADALRLLRERCEREIREADGPGILSEMDALHNQESTCNAKIDACRHAIEEASERIATMLAQRNRPPAKGFTKPDIAAVWPLVGEYLPQDRPRLQDEIASVERDLRELERQDLALSEQLGTGRETLDLEQASKRMAQQERSFQTKERAGLLIAATFDRLMRKMLPRTEYYMQQLLPLLTRGRYHDVRLATEPEDQISSGGPLQVSLWEPAANDYISLPTLSGGVADQVSLALRLAFAIASLPRDLNAAPGFLLLDEPLSLASRDRAQSLATIITGETLGQHFEQVLFVSHDATFDTSGFPYHIYIDSGIVVETNLTTELNQVPDTPAPVDTNVMYNTNGNGTDPTTEKQEVVSLETVSNVP